MSSILDNGIFFHSTKGSSVINEMTVNDTTFKLSDGIGPLLRFVRVENNIEVEDIAKAVDKSMNFIYQIERGERKASPNLMRELVKCYGIPTHYPLLIMLEGIISLDQYLAIKQQEHSVASNTIEHEPHIDLLALLDNEHSKVLFDKKELSTKHKYMLLGAIEVLIKRWFKK